MNRSTNEQVKLLSKYMLDKLCPTKGKLNLIQPMTLEEALFMPTEIIEQEQTISNNPHGYNGTYASTSRHNSNNISYSNRQILNSQNIHADQQNFFSPSLAQEYMNTINQNHDMNDTAVFVNDFLIKADREIMCINQFDPRNLLFTYKCQYIFDGECFMNILTGHEVLCTNLKNRVVFDKHGVQRDELNMNDVYVRAGKTKVKHDIILTAVCIVLYLLLTLNGITVINNVYCRLLCMFTTTLSPPCTTASTSTVMYSDTQLVLQIPPI